MFVFKEIFSANFLFTKRKALCVTSSYKIWKQGLLEGAKACRKEDGQVVLFRPEQNAIRMQIGAERMCMTSPSIDQFVYALKQTVLANKRWV